MIWAGVAGSMVMAALLVTAALSKLSHPIEWRTALAGYGMLPAASVRAVAATVAAVELVAGVALAAGIRPFGWIAAFALSATFLATLTIARARGATGECGCFAGLAPGRIDAAAQARAAGVLLISGLAAFDASSVELPLATRIVSAVAVAAATQLLFAMRRLSAEVA